MKPEPSEVKADQSLKTVSTLHHNDSVRNLSEKIKKK